MKDQLIANTVDRGTAYLSVQVPYAMNLEHVPKRAPVLLEAPQSGKLLQLRANGRFTAVPAGIVYLTAKPRDADSVTVAIELKSGQWYHYKFSGDRFCRVLPHEFRFTAIDRALPGKMGVIFVRFLDGRDMKPTQLSHLIRSTADGGLSISFAGEPLLPLMAEVVSPGHARTLLALAPKAGPGKGYTTAHLSLERRNATVMITSYDTDPDLALAWRLSLRGNFTEALRIVQPYLQRYRAGETPNELDAAGLAYILIRAGQFDWLGPWALDLVHSRQVRADGLVIASEWFGNAGCHVSALNLLRQLPHVGFPLFTDGYSLATARLAAYATSRYGKPEAPRVQPAQFEPHEGEEREDVNWRKYRTLIGDSKESVCVPWIEGQQLIPWNCDEARHVHQHLTRGIRNVDWSSYLVRFGRSSHIRLRRLLAGPFEWLETRLSPYWSAVVWRIPYESEIEPSDKRRA
jgi:hypothetical protein